MDPSLQELLNRHWHFLIRYISPTDTLISILNEEKILPASMIDDVKKGTTRKEKNERLLKSLKLRGNMSYRKFRDAMMKCGQVFIADLLWEEADANAVPLIEASDLTSVPALNVALSPEDVKQLVDMLNARVKGKMLRNEWRKDSGSRMQSLVHRANESITETANMNRISGLETHVERLQEEMKRKNDTIRSLTLEINILNKEILTFTQRHSVSTSATSSKLGGDWETKGTESPESPTYLKTPKRFQVFETGLATVVNRLRGIMGEEVPKDGKPVSMEELDLKAKKTEMWVRELETALDRLTAEQEEIFELLFPGQKPSPERTLPDSVKKYLKQEQQNRYALLMDIDRLSRKLRDIPSTEQKSGLKALQQSAVTGTPPLEIVDYRFLRNHVALLEADAEHIAKKLSWRMAELNMLKHELEELKNNTKYQKPAPVRAVQVSD